MTFLLNGKFAFIIEITIQGKVTEIQTIDRIKAFVRAFNGEIRPDSKMKRGARTNGEIWIFTAQKQENTFLGCAKCLWFARKKPNEEGLRKLGRQVSQDFIDLKITRIETEEDFIIRSVDLV